MDARAFEAAISVDNGGDGQTASDMTLADSLSAKTFIRRRSPAFAILPKRPAIS
jgi:hypothetical protein